MPDRAPGERVDGVILACAFASFADCRGGRNLDDGSLRRGTRITDVQAEYGLPDVIVDVSGDERRFYVPTRRPEHEWPADAPRTFYYLGRNVAVTFVSGKAVRAEPIDRELRDAVLAPLVQRQEHAR